MKKNFLPAFIMLTAGAIDCVLSFIEHLSPLAFTKRLLIVLLIFFALGTVIQWIVNANFTQPEEEEVPDGDEAGEGGEESEAETEEEPLGEEMEEEMENINAESSGE